MLLMIMKIHLEGSGTDLIKKGSNQAITTRRLLILLFLFNPALTGLPGNCRIHECQHIPDKREVWLYNFYDVGPPCWSLVTYHTGIGFTDYDGKTGYWYYNSKAVYSTETCKKDPSGYLNGKDFLGHVDLTTDEVQAIIDDMSGKKGVPCSKRKNQTACFDKENYTWYDWNCNYFTGWLAYKLGLWESYPKEIWMMRSIGKRSSGSELPQNLEHVTHHIIQSNEASGS